MNCVGRYCATLTAKPMASAAASGAASSGALTRHQKAQRQRPSASAVHS